MSLFKTLATPCRGVRTWPRWPRLDVVWTSILFNPVRPSPVKIYRSAAIDVGDVDVGARKGHSLFGLCPLSQQESDLKYVIIADRLGRHLCQLTDLS